MRINKIFLVILFIVFNVSFIRGNEYQEIKFDDPQKVNELNYIINGVTEEIKKSYTVESEDKINVATRDDFDDFKKDIDKNIDRLINLTIGLVGIIVLLLGGAIVWLKGEIHKIGEKVDSLNDTVIKHDTLLLKQLGK